MKPVIFLPEAFTEMNDAALFYETKVLGLGESFLDTIQRGIGDIQQNPKRWAVISRNIRRRLVGRFPYGILYRETAENIVIVAIMHLHRNPKYWTGRI